MAADRKGHRTNRVTSLTALCYTDPATHQRSRAETRAIPTLHYLFPDLHGLCCERVYEVAVVGDEEYPAREVFERR